MGLMTLDPLAVDVGFCSLHRVRLSSIDLPWLARWQPNSS
jgi:hypothetical protein